MHKVPEANGVRDSTSILVTREKLRCLEVRSEYSSEKQVETVSLLSALLVDNSTHSYIHIRHCMAPQTLEGNCNTCERRADNSILRHTEWKFYKLFDGSTKAIMPFATYFHNNITALAVRPFVPTLLRKGAIHSRTTLLSPTLFTQTILTTT